MFTIPWDVVVYMIILIWIGVRLIGRGKMLIQKKEPALEINGHLAIFLFRVFKGKKYSEIRKKEILQRQNVQLHGRNSIAVGTIFIVTGILGVIMMLILLQ